MMNKETIKEFLKPNKKKLLVFVVIDILLLFIPIIPCSIFPPAISPSGARFPRMMSTSCCFYDCIVFSEIFLKPGAPSVNCSWGIIILTLIISYIFSCGTIFAYDKFRGRKI